MKTFEELFRAARRSQGMADDLLVKGADGRYWNAQVQREYEWFMTGRAQSLALLKALHAVVGMPNVEGFGKLMADVEEVLENEL